RREWPDRIASYFLAVFLRPAFFERFFDAFFLPDAALEPAPPPPFTASYVVPRFLPARFTWPEAMSASSVGRSVLVSVPSSAASLPGGTGPPAALSAARVASGATVLPPLGACLRPAFLLPAFFFAGAVLAPPPPPEPPEPAW